VPFSDGVVVPVDPPIGTGPVEDQCLMSEPATVAAWCAGDASWTSAWGGCPTVTELVAALQPGAFVTTPTAGSPVGNADVFDCALGADRWTVIRIQSAYAGAGNEYLVFDGAGNAFAAAYDATEAEWTRQVCCDGTFTTQWWVGDVPPAGLACTRVVTLEVYHANPTTPGGSGSTTGGSGP
jgi:hypothetical protein